MNYSEFVNEVKLSDHAKYNRVMLNTLIQLDTDYGCNYSRLINGAIGASAEAVELLELFTYDSPKELAIDELGDVMFYMAVTAESLAYSKESIYLDRNFKEFHVNHDIKDLVIRLVISTGKYLDIVKKIVFQGKDFSDNIHKLQDGYKGIYKLILLICERLDVTESDVQNANIDKLNARYKNNFSVQESENKK